MARQVRIEYSGALHHVRSRGNNCGDIFFDDGDRLHFLVLLAEAIRHYGWLVPAYCLMTNHFHLVITTPRPNLSRGMRWLLGSYASWFNKRHWRTGHLFGDRFHSDLVESESYLTELVRYVVLNPVRAQMVSRPEQYRWSSYQATAGLAAIPPWLAIETLVPFFGSPESWQANYREYVTLKIDATERLWDRCEHQIYLGSEAWCREIRRRVESLMLSDVHPATQRKVGRPKMAHIIRAVGKALGVTESWIRTTHGNMARLLAAWLGWYEGLLGLRSIAAALRLSSRGRVSDMIRQCDCILRGNPTLQAKVDLALASLG